MEVVQALKLTMRNQKYCYWAIASILYRKAKNVVPDDIQNIKVKKSVKILGVHFSYAFQARHKLNVDELISSIQHKLRIWKWRDLTIIGRIQIVKTFIIPIFLYRVSSIPMGKDFVK